MIRVDASATIDRPVEDVAHYLTDIERMTEWTDMTASRRLTEGPTGIGDAGPADGAGLVVEVPRAGVLPEERELSFHASTVPGRGDTRTGSEGPSATIGAGQRVVQEVPAISGQGRSRSTSRARSRSSASAWWRPMTCIPTGSPST